MNTATLQKIDPRVQRISESLLPLRKQIAKHTLLRRLTSLAAVRLFMQQHSFAVWDFISLLKCLFSRVVNTSVPWVPSDDTDSVRLLYELLISEESDKLPGKQAYASHFNLYLIAMIESSADINPILDSIDACRHGASLDKALDDSRILPSTRAFVKQTFATFTEPTPVIAANFLFGREALVPELFIPLLAKINQHKIPRCKSLCYYLHRHIQIDSQDHFPKAAQLLVNVCADESAAWEQAKASAHSALQARLDFLTGLERLIVAKT